MRRICFFLFVYMVAAATTFAQYTIVKGTLVGEETAEGEPFATVRVFWQGSEQDPIAMFLTDVDGHFEQQLDGNGLVDMHFSSVGKADLVRTVRIGDKAVVQLDSLYIKDDANMLGTVEVVAMRPLVKMEVDKMSYNVADDKDSKAVTVLDMLRKVPMVTVDGQDNITVNGSSSFKVYVDGRPNVMFSSNPSQVFKSMPASAVKSIEVITNPGAKYDAEGAGGVLNIVMNKLEGSASQALDGYNGSFRLSAGNTSLGGGAFVSGQSGKLSYSANVVENYVRPGTTKLTRDQVNGDGHILTQSSTRTRIPFTMGNVSLGYDLDSMSNINATVSFSDMNMKNPGSSTTRMFGGDYGQGFGYGTDIYLKTRRTSFNTNASYQRFLNKDRTRSVSLTYQIDHNPSVDRMDCDFDMGSTSFIDLTDRYSDDDERTTDHTLQLDFTSPVAKGHSLELGAKFMSRRATSDARFYLDGTYDASSSLDYLYRNRILAGYAEYDGSFGKLSAKAGLRYEHTWQDVTYRTGNGTDFDKDYGCLVPSASISYALSQRSNMGLTYNMRISRPGISYLNPYVDKSSPTAISYGNTDLDVEKSHNFALVYNLFSPKVMLNVNLHHNFTDNAIEQYNFFDGQMINTTYGNVVRKHQTGVNVYANWLVANNTRLFANGGVSYNDFSSDALGVSNNAWQANAMLGVQQTLPWDIRLGTYIITQTRTHSLQGWASGYNMITANLSKSFLDDKLTVGVSGLVGLSDNARLKVENQSSGAGFSNHMVVRVPISGVTLSLTYNFGNSKRQARQHASRVTNDYIEETTQGEMLNNVGKNPGSSLSAQ